MLRGCNFSCVGTRFVFGNFVGFRRMSATGQDETNGGAGNAAVVQGERVQLRKQRDDLYLELNSLREEIVKLTAAGASGTIFEIVYGDLEARTNTAATLNQQIIGTYKSDKAVTAALDLHQGHVRQNDELYRRIQNHLNGVQVNPSTSTNDQDDDSEEEIDVGVAASDIHSIAKDPPKTAKKVERKDISPGALVDDEAPDDWIERYYEGNLEPTLSSDGGRAAVQVTLEQYDGKPLNWFRWIDLFRVLVHERRISPTEKLGVLVNSLPQDCRYVVQGLGGGERAYKEALLHLKQTCGRRDVIMACHRQQLESLAPGAESDTAAYVKFAEKVRLHLFEMSLGGEQTSYYLIDKVLSKLSVHDRRDWSMFKETSGTVNLNHFGNWLSRRARACLSADQIAASQYPGAKPSHKARTHQVTGRSDNSKAQKCPRCNYPHRLEKCHLFQRAAVGGRLAFVNGHKLCQLCLKSGHHVSACRSDFVCGVDGCTQKHNRLLHSSPTEATGAVTGRVGVAAKSDDGSAFGMTYVFVTTVNGESLRLNVLMDSGSNTTMVRESLLRRLGLTGQPSDLNVAGALGIKSSHLSTMVEVPFQTVEGVDFEIKAFAVPEPCDPIPHVDWPKLKNNWSHMSDLPLSKVGGRVDLLIGHDNNYFLTSQETREGTRFQPSASRTRLGWVATGPIGDSNGSLSARVHLTIGNNADQKLNELFGEFLNTESYGSEFPMPKQFTPEESRAVERVEKETKKLEVGYEIPLLWRDGEPKLGNNYSVVKKRFDGLVRKFDRDPGYADDYRKAMNKYISEGYVRRLQPHELDGPQFFLPHHGVYKSSSEKRKLRIVFDAAASFQGRSLNDALLSGPAFQSKLPSVLTRFRLDEVAVAADIEAMFSRIRLRQEDARYQRFLWKEVGDEDAAVYQMDRVMFGAKCSPFLAHYVVRRAARDSGLPEVEAIVESNFYVDDYLKSAPTELEAIQKAELTSSALAFGDFHLRNWLSNSSTVRQHFSGSESEVRTDLPLEGEGDEVKVLGVKWKPSEDVFVFAVAPPTDLIYSRRGLLSCLASVFDPLGFASPLTVQGKVMLRRLSMNGLSWDDPVPEEAREWWSAWLDRLKDAGTISIPRCLCPNRPSIVETQLHTFSDASEEACAAVTYIRNVYSDGSVIVRIVMARTKLAPQKTLSVAKLELQAALMGVRLCRYICDAIQMEFDARYFWTDSSCVRNWVRATSAFYLPFVSNRIGEIQMETQPNEWRYLPGELNCSDFATRMSFGPGNAIPKQWFTAPEFLISPAENWPIDLPWCQPNEEIRSAHAFRVIHVSTTDSVFEFDPEDLPSFTSLDGELLDLVRQAQFQQYSVEINRLKKNKGVAKSSSLINFSPFLDDHGILRVGGRLSVLDLPYHVKHPAILPPRHPLSVAILKAFHQRLRHLGVDTVLAESRQFFWVVRGREMCKRIQRECGRCALVWAQPVHQQMSDLPKDRAAILEPPFSHVAVDYFGPIQTGRTQSKRYVLLVTCLSTRAVFLDVSRSLSTPDFLLTMRRFIAIYGTPATIRSDCGLNFVGASNLMRDEVRRLESDPDVAEALRKEGTQWIFQPPGSPHTGGAHESLVRVAKRALHQSLWALTGKDRWPSEEELRTALYEISWLMNGRPLAYVSSDPKDPRPVTPNDLLGRRTKGLNLIDQLPSGSLGQRNGFVRGLVTSFWDNWIKIYLPSLISRSKWKTRERNLETGDVVLIRQDQIPRGHWPVGTVVQVTIGADGLVRRALVRTQDGEFQRSVHQLCLLPPDAEADPGRSVKPYRASGGSVRAKIDQVEQHRYNLRPIGGRDANLADLTSIG